MDDRPLRPLALGEIIDTSFKVYVRNWRPLLALVAIVVIPAGILEFVLLAGAIPQEALDRLADPNLVIDEATLDAARSLLGVTAAALFIRLLASMLANAGVMRAVAEVYLGRSPNWRDSLRYAANRLPVLLAAVLLVMTVMAALVGGAWLIVGVNLAGSGTVSGGLVALVSPILLVLAAWIGVSWTVAIPALVIEGIGPIQALARSFSLIRRRWWPALGTLVTVVLIVAVAGELLSRILGAFVGDGTLGTAAVTIGISVATSPFLVAVLAVLYFDLRARKERFTLSRLAVEIGAPPPEEPAQQPPTEGWPPLPPDATPDG